MVTRIYKGYREAAEHHVAEAQKWQAIASSLEARAAEHAGNDEVAALLLAKDEALAFAYKRATGNRNGHQQQAIMYGIMALLEAGK